MRSLQQLSAHLILVLLVFVCSNALAAPAAISLNPNIKYQKWIGLEAHNQSGQDKVLFPNWQNALLDAAVNDLGISRVRLEVRSGSEHTQDIYTNYQPCINSGGTNCLTAAEERCLRFSTVNDDADPFHINWAGFKFSMLDNTVTKVILPLKQKLQARGEKLHINLLYVGFTQYLDSGCPTGLRNIHIDTPEEYAEFMTAASLYLRNTYGIVPDTWEFSLEPEHTEFVYPNRATDLMGRALVAAGNRLAANGFTPRFSFPSASYIENVPGWFDNAKQVPGLLNYVKELSYHRYGTNSSANLQAVKTRAKQNNLEMAQLEYLNADNRELHEDLKLMENVSWQQFTIGGLGTNPAGRAAYFHVDAANNYAIVMHDEAKYFRQYFRYIRPDAQRIEATSNSGNFDPVAFVNKNGKYVVVIRVQNTAGAFTISNLPFGTYSITYTTSPAQSLISLPNVTVSSGSPTLAATMPAAGTISIFQSSGTIATPTPTAAPLDTLPPSAPSGLQVGG